MARREKQTIEIEKTHRNLLPSFHQAVTSNYSDFLGTALIVNKQKWKEAIEGLELSRELAKQVHFRGSAFKDEIPAASKTINLYASLRCVDPSPSVGSSHKSSQMMPLPPNCTLNGHLSICRTGTSGVVSMTRGGAAW
jgi:hypothetical protein